MSRLKTERMTTPQTKQMRERIRIRILRSWRGYGPGAIIEPPAGARQILLSATDQLGRQVAEIVTDEVPPVPEPVTEPVPPTDAETDGGMTGTLHVKRKGAST